MLHIKRSPIFKTNNLHHSLSTPQISFHPPHPTPIHHTLPSSTTPYPHPPHPTPIHHTLPSSTTPYTPIHHTLPPSTTPYLYPLISIFMTKSIVYGNKLNHAQCIPRGNSATVFHHQLAQTLHLHIHGGRL